MTSTSIVEAIVKGLQNEGIKIILDDGLISAIQDIKTTAQLINIIRVFQNQYKSYICEAELSYNPYVGQDDTNNIGGLVLTYKLNCQDDKIKEIDDLLSNINKPKNIVIRLTNMCHSNS